MLNALSTRLVDYYTSTIPSRINGVATNVIGSASLSAIKELLADGHILRVTSRANYNSIQDDDNIWYIIRTFKNTGTNATNSLHSYCIVGYDDNVWCDINNNGIQDANETGAFKMANSYGPSWKNNGYCWIMYDALNYHSFVGNGLWEQSLSGERCPVFSTIETNTFNYISVGDFKNYFVAKTNYTNVARKYESTQSQVIINGNTSVDTAPQTVFDNSIKSFSSYKSYSPIITDIDDILTGIDFGVYANNYVSTNSFNAYLVDNKGNLLSNMIKQVNSKLYKTGIFDLFKGDVDYSYSLSSTDVTYIQEYLTGSREFSDLQEYLADFNSDGKINVRDVALLMRAIP